MRRTIGKATARSGLALILGAVMLAWPPTAEAASVSIPMNMITSEGIGGPIGVVRAEDTPEGLVLTPDLTGLPPGERGFHVHENPSCEPGMRDGEKVAGLAAGGHLDPADTGEHLGPHGDGHLGDLPVLKVAVDGTAKSPVTAPRLRVEDIVGHSLMIHAGGDNYSDEPEPLGGGGARVACGVIR
jgi:superoxide dismutase, Cu-Zn family